ncbi:MAG: DNA polymerase, partial [Gemmatimonadota bacterium]
LPTDQLADPVAVETVSEGAAVPDATVLVVDQLEAVAEVVRRLAGAGQVALRAWVTGPEPRDWRLVGLALSDAIDTWYFPFAHESPDGPLAGTAPPRNLPPLTDPGLLPLARLLADSGVAKVGHDLKAEWEACRVAGVELGGLNADLMLVSFVLDPGRRSHALDTLALDHLGRNLPPRSDLLGRRRNVRAPELVEPAEAAAQCASELGAILALEEQLRPGLAESGMEQLYRDIEMALTPVLVDMEWAGIAIDQALFHRLSQELARDLAELERAIVAAAGTAFNLNSPKQMAVVLFDQLRLPVLKKTKTGASTDAEVLEQLADQGHEVPRLILEHRELQKLRSTYVD